MRAVRIPRLGDYGISLGPSTGSCGCPSPSEVQPAQHDRDPDNHAPERLVSGRLPLHRARRASLRTSSAQSTARGQARAAVEMAALLAGPGGHLTLLAVTAESGSGAFASAAISPGRVDRVLSHAKRIADHAGVPSSTIVDPGEPPTEVILARASAYDLLAIGAPAMSWLGGVLTGRVATSTLSRLTTPMLFARRSFTGSLDGRQILVASDGRGGLGSHRGPRGTTRTHSGGTGHARERSRRRVEDEPPGDPGAGARTATRAAERGPPYIEPGGART